MESFSVVDISLSMRCPYNTTVLNLWSGKGDVCTLRTVLIVHHLYISSLLLRIPLYYIYYNNKILFINVSLCIRSNLKEFSAFSNHGCRLLFCLSNQFTLPSLAAGGKLLICFDFATRKDLGFMYLAQTSLTIESLFPYYLPPA